MPWSPTSTMRVYAWNLCRIGNPELPTDPSRCEVGYLSMTWDGGAMVRRRQDEVDGLLQVRLRICARGIGRWERLTPEQVRFRHVYQGARKHPARGFQVLAEGNRSRKIEYFVIHVLIKELVHCLVSNYN